MRILLLWALPWLAACTAGASLVDSSTQEELSLRGDFRSVRGVMDPLSCYCFEAGYLTTAEGEVYALCWAEEEKGLSGCDSLRVKVVATQKTIDPGANSPCRAGERTLYVVQSFTCED